MLLFKEPYPTLPLKPKQHLYVHFKKVIKEKKSIVITTMQSVCSNWREQLRMSEYILCCSVSIFFTNIISSHPTSKTWNALFKPHKLCFLSIYLANFVRSLFASPSSVRYQFTSQNLYFIIIALMFIVRSLSISSLSLFLENSLD